MIVRELLTRLGFRIDDRNINIYNTTINNIRNNADRAASSVQGLFAALLGFGTLRSIAKTADEMQSLEARVGMLPQTVTSAAEAFDVVAARATAARGSINAYTNFYLKLQNAGKDFIATQEEGLRITDTITKALVVGGSTAQEQRSALLQFGQAIGSGVLQGDEFRALGEAAPQLLDELAKAIGIPRTELKKFASQGKITSKVVIDAMSKIADVFEDRFKQMPITIGQATTIIGNRWAVFLNRMNRESNAVTSIANTFIAGFDLIEKALDSLVEFFGGATNTVKAFGIAVAAALAPLVFRGLVGSITLLLSPIGLLIAGLTVLGLVLEDVYQWMNFGDSVIGEYISGLAGMAMVVGIINKVRDAFNGLMGSTAATTFIAKLSDLRNKVIAAFNGGIITKFIAALVRLKDYLYDIIPIDRIMANMSQMFSGLITLFFGLLDIVSGLFKTTLGFLTGDFDLWFEGVKQIVNGLGDVFGGLWEILKGFFKQNLVNLQVLFTIAFDAIKSIITDSIYGGIVWAAKKGWEFLKSLFGFGMTANIGVPSMTPSASTVAGAAASPNGVPMAGSGVNVTVNQTLPPGTAQETANAAQSAVTQAFNGMPTDRLARQLGQVQ